MTNGAGRAPLGTALAGSEQQGAALPLTGRGSTPTARVLQTGCGDTQRWRRTGSRHKHHNPIPYTLTCARDAER